MNVKIEKQTYRLSVNSPLFISAFVTHACPIRSFSYSSKCKFQLLINPWILKEIANDALIDFTQNM